MHDYQKIFIELAIKYEALRFGEFTLKSGRISPYFFNASRFDDCHALTVIGECMAKAIEHKKLIFDGLFGAAYKGIPLVSALGTALYRLHNQNVKISYNRKESKSHGERGSIVGAQLNGRILAVDDVLSAGTAIKEVIGIIQQHPEASLTHALVALDRQEISPDQSLSTVDYLFLNHGVQVHSIIKLDDLLKFLETSTFQKDYLEKMTKYRDTYGAAS